jgi:hypothetical protein
MSVVEVLMSSGTLKVARPLAGVSGRVRSEAA